MQHTAEVIGEHGMIRAAVHRTSANFKAQSLRRLAAVSRQILLARQLKASYKTR